jgi:tRNA U55 pseudouridine synthase TruB
MARRLTLQPYLQIPPMHSAKKRNGKPLYELAREGIEVEREPKLCQLYRFDVPSYESPRATFSLRCSSGTYVRTLAQDLGRLLGSVALVESLSRSESGGFRLANAMTTDEIAAATTAGQAIDELPAWVPFDRLLHSYDRANATREEASALMQGRSHVLMNLLRRVETAPPALVGEDATFDDGDAAREDGAADDDGAGAIGQGATSVRAGPPLAIYCDNQLIGIARRADGVWGLERVFTREGLR